MKLVLIKFLLQSQHTSSNQCYFFSLLSIIIFFGKIYPILIKNWLFCLTFLKKKTENPGKCFSKFLLQDSYRITAARFQNDILILFKFTNFLFLFCSKHYWKLLAKVYFFDGMKLKTRNCKLLYIFKKTFLNLQCRLLFRYI